MDFWIVVIYISWWKPSLWQPTFFLLLVFFSAGIILKRQNSSSNYNRSYRTSCRPSGTRTRLSKWSPPIQWYRRPSVWNTWTSHVSTKAIRVCWICSCGRPRRRRPSQWCVNKLSMVYHIVCCIIVHNVLIINKPLVVRSVFIF